MGNFYTGLYCRPRDASEFEQVLASCQDTGFASQPVSGWIYITTHQMENAPADRPAGDTSRLIGASSVAVIVCNADDDAFGLLAYSDGREVGRFVFDPVEMLELGDTSGWQGLLDTASALDVDPSELEVAGLAEAVFAIERHERIAEAMRLPPEMIGMSTDSIASGEGSALVWRPVGEIQGQG